MPTRHQAQSRFTSFYYARVLSSGKVFDRLDVEFPQVARAINSLAGPNSSDQAGQFLDFLQALSPYLQARQMNRLLLDYCQSGLQAALCLGANSGWLYLLIHQAYWVLSEWQTALPAVQMAIKLTKDVVPSVHARALLALGSAQLNQGQYRTALKTLAKAEKQLAVLSDYAGVAACKGEVAAYYLNRSDYAKALALFQELADYERRTDPDGPSTHTAFMLGVTYRRVKKYKLSIQELCELIRRSEERRDRTTVATATHHLAWTLFECGRIDEAEPLGRQAKEWYDRNEDPRGSSDAHEQLGVFALARHDLASAQEYLERSLSVRQQIGNWHGAASSLRRLAKLHWVQREYFQALGFLRKSIALYYRLEVLSHQRLFNIFTELLHWNMRKYTEKNDASFGSMSCATANLYSRRILLRVLSPRARSRILLGIRSRGQREPATPEKRKNQHKRGMGDREI